MVTRLNSSDPDDAIIRQSQADILASRVTPHPAVMQAVGIALAPTDAEPAERAVVWAETARESCFGELEGSFALHAAIAHTAAKLGRAPVGAPGRLPQTYETAVAETPYVLVFELVTWTKAGEVVAILALASARKPPLHEAPLWAERG